jgi:hypothetical protein
VSDGLGRRRVLVMLENEGGIRLREMAGLDGMG